MKEKLSLLDLKGKILFTNEPSSRSVERFSFCLDGVLENFEDKLFIFKNDKVEAVIISVEEYEMLKKNYDEVKESFND